MGPGEDQIAIKDGPPFCVRTGHSCLSVQQRNFMHVGNTHQIPYIRLVVPECFPSCLTLKARKISLLPCEVSVHLVYLLVFSFYPEIKYS